VPRALLDSPLELAALARERARRPGDARELDRRIDACAYRLFELPRRLMKAAEQGFWGERFAEEIQALERWLSDPLGTVGRKEGTS
jgi:hypothetical protein